MFDIVEPLSNFLSTNEYNELLTSTTPVIFFKEVFIVETKNDGEYTPAGTVIVKLFSLPALTTPSS